MSPATINPPPSGERNLLVASATRQIAALKEENARLEALTLRLEEECLRLRERLELTLKH